jgi:trehalose synthase
VQLTEVQVGAEPLERFRPLIGDERTDRFLEVAAAAREALAGRTIWNVNSTASGGGVAEMLSVLLAYARGAGIDTRWLVVEGTPAFFDVTKRLHNRLHGAPGTGELDEAARETYADVTAANAEALAPLVRPDDVVLLHDPQTAGMVPHVVRTGARVVWRAHIGTDVPDEHVADAWDFLERHLRPAHRFVFSRREHVHAWMPEDRVSIVSPSIDPFSPKNQDLDPATVRSILACIGLVPGPLGATTFHRRDGSPGTVVRAASLVRGEPVHDPDVPLVVQVSRWDRLKDMAGVLRGFAAGVPAPAELALVGPVVESVTDDPEGAEVLAECARAWDELPPDVRARIRLVCLPMQDTDENAAMVNAIQRHAAVVVQKSLQEGFGLTVSEALIKERAVVASRVGGIQDQVRDGVDGVLLDDPRDLGAMAAAVRGLLEDDDRRAALGRSGRARVLGQFVGDRHLTQYAELFALRR